MTCGMSGRQSFSASAGLTPTIYDTGRMCLFAASVLSRLHQGLQVSTQLKDNTRLKLNRAQSVQSPGKLFFLRPRVVHRFLAGPTA